MTAIKFGIYRHYKGKLYRVHYIATHSETQEPFVVYEALYDNKVGSHWVRPLKMFLEMVETKEGIKPRFEYIGDKRTVERL
jgi:hypothetical protein